MRSKKGVSDIVITVSLILIAIVAVGIIASFMVPLVQKQLGKASSCLALREHFKVVTASSATCYNANKNVSLSILRGSEKEDSKGFVVAIRTSTGDTVSTREETGLTDKGNGKLYVYSIADKGSVEAVTIATILPNGDVCDAFEYTGISPC
jgi:uncharacterized protein YpmB